jgi:shikimate kinase
MANRRENIVLIGMPGVGKSTAGVVLAKIAGFSFVDSDLLIQEEEHRRLSEIIEQEGLVRFKEIENRINAAIDVRHHVIATGGSVIYGEEAMEHLRRIGVVVYLKVSYETILGRLNNVKGRGVAIEEGQTLLDLYQERTVLYEKYADVTVELDRLTIPQTAEAVITGVRMIEPNLVEIDG